MTIGVIGYGNMGESFSKAIKGHAEILVYDVSDEKRQRALSEGFGVANSLEFLLESSDWLLLAVKPKDVEGVIKTIREKIGDRLLISVVAGLSLSKMEEMNQSLEIPLSVSIGFACYPDDEKDFRKLLEVADKRMYQIKVDRKGFSST